MILNELERSRCTGGYPLNLEMDSNSIPICYSIRVCEYVRIGTPVEYIFSGMKKRRIL